MTYLRENDPACHLIYYLSKCFPYEFMVSIASFKSSLLQQYFLNYGAIYNKIGNKAWYTLGHAYLVSYWSLPKCYLKFSVGSNRDILLSFISVPSIVKNMVITI